MEAIWKEMEDDILEFAKRMDARWTKLRESLKRVQQQQQQLFAYAGFGEIQIWAVLPLQVSLLTKRPVPIYPQQILRKYFVVEKTSDTINMQP